MNIYLKKKRWKLLLLLCAVLIGSFTLWYTNQLTNQLKQGEKRKLEQWAEAIHLISLPEIGPNSPVIKLFNLMIPNNTTIPVIIVDSNDTIISYNNIKVSETNPDKTVYRRLNKMKRRSIAYAHDASLIDSLSLLKWKPLKYYYLIIKDHFSVNAGMIEIDFGNNYKQYLYYEDSILLKRLSWFPIIQLLVVSVFIVVAYMAFSGSRKAEQNQVWVGMAKETAHQLGTPTSSLLAWIDLLKMKTDDLPLIDEMKQDVERLRTITDRFSKIGAKPDLLIEPIIPMLKKTISYLKTRTSSHVDYVIDSNNADDLCASISAVLFEWVIENLCKNAIDAMEGKGKINISVIKNKNQVYIDVHDSGKGIHKSHFKTIFEPGFTTKSRGWGLGLTLVKRIIEQYHHGKIFVADSIQGEGTTFRIVLNVA